MSFKRSITVSCGIAFYPTHGKNFIDLRAAADKAMYEGRKSLANNDDVLVVADS